MSPKFPALARRGRYVALLATAAWLALALGLSSSALARPQRLACGASRGPCQSADAFDYLLGPQGPDLVLTNFGLLFPGDRSNEWQVVCDDNFGLATPDRVRLAPSGDVFAASDVGLFYATDQGCAWSRATGDIAGRVVLDVAFDRQNPSLVWAMGDTPRVLWRSTDGGRSFNKSHTFDVNLGFHRLAVAPSDARHIYLFGRGRGNATPFAWSDDGGQTFTAGDLVTGASPAPKLAFELYAVAPDDPRALYFVVFDTAGDQIWRSTDAGATTTPLFTLLGRDAFGGLAFGATSQTLYLAGTDPFPLDGNPPGRLHVSRDGGKTWEAPINSGDRGPRYSCLVGGTEGKLYACGPGAIDAFMVGVSTDEGKTWSAVATMKQIAGVKACVLPRCLSTETWLCDIYGQCPPGVEPMPNRPPEPGPIRDAGTDACIGSACEKPGGCGCRTGGAQTGGGLPWALLLMMIAVLVRARTRRGQGARRSST
jgi:MYXO-CTERM domain-containing protein